MENFRSGFQRQNYRVMVDGNFTVCDTKVYGKTKSGRRNRDIILGDIDGCYISAERTSLRQLLPSSHRLSDYDFVIEDGDHVFFEVTALPNNYVWKTHLEDIEKKVIFHSQIIRNKAFHWDIDHTKHVLILVYNGADHVKVDATFKNLCNAWGIRGATVYLASDVLCQWNLWLQLKETKKKIAMFRQVMAESIECDSEESD